MCQQRFLAASQNSEQEADVLMTANVEKLSQHVAALQQQLQVVTEEAVTSHAAAARAQAEVRELEGRMFKNEEKIKALRDFVFYYKKELRTVHNEKAMWQEAQAWCNFAVVPCMAGSACRTFRCAKK
ncbi:hypothetical protein Vafri_3654 [Volvox africanus]|uniref:Uncharacterized protein n=1 Tax=Volvox africanus TaxID=51714 RepID=A0A8J4ETX5_9CHLO|nr:hypothetical protein Vafri_3654 [Volvox africanus]